MPFDCLLGAWRVHESELRGFLIHRLGDADSTDDLLQDTFSRRCAKARTSKKCGTRERGCSMSPAMRGWTTRGWERVGLT